MGRGAEPWRDRESPDRARRPGRLPLDPAGNLESPRGTEHSLAWKLDTPDVRGPRKRARRRARPGEGGGGTGSR